MGHQFMISSVIAGSHAAAVKLGYVNDVRDGGVEVVHNGRGARGHNTVNYDFSQ
jgi:hypothetical protein